MRKQVVADRRTSPSRRHTEAALEPAPAALLQRAHPRTSQLGPPGVLQLQRAVGNRTVAALLARPGRIVQRMRSGYAIELPAEEQWRLNGLVRDDRYPQQKVDTFVNGLKREQMKFFDGSTAALLESSRWPRKDISDPFGARAPVTLWQCPNCLQASTYQGIDRGHITNWKDELKKAGVKNLAEATLAYNNLLNLRIECRTCNVSHAYERGESGMFTDLPTLEDFGSGKAAKEKHKEFLEGYEGVDMDAYDMSDSFIDTSEKEELTLVTRTPITLTEDIGGINSGVSETFWGGAQVRVTGKTYGSGWVEVEVIESRDSRLPNKIKAWATVKHLKTGVVSGY